MMPEGPEVRTVVDQLQGGVGMRFQGVEFLSGRYVSHGPPATYRPFMKTLSPPGSDDDVDRIKEWNTKGKFIYIVLDDDGAKKPPNDDDFQRSIWVTLGMSGRFVSESMNPDQRTQARWAVQLMNDDDKRFQIFYHDPRNFGTLKFCLSATELEKKLASLGPDILEPATTTEDVFVNLVGQSKPAMNVCKFLMNQKKICGIGNYILAEGLYRASIDPFCSLQELTEEQQRLLFRELQATALTSYDAQGMTRGKGGAYRDVEGNRGQFEFQLQCYGRTTCAKGKEVIKEMDGPHGRTIWYTEDQLFTPRIMRFGSMDDDDKDKLNGEGSAPDKKRTATKPKPVTSKTSPPMRAVSTTAASGDPVERLLGSLDDDGWRTALSDTTSSAEFRDLATFLETERESEVIYPPEEDVLSALSLCPLDKVKVVIVGQDPYHGPGQGHGLSFSVRPGVRPPPSLVNIFKEARLDVGISPPSSGYLKCWAEQGVLLLNSVMTVRRGKANSHAKRGWENFTDEIVHVLNEEKEGLVFLLWGGPAHRKAANVDEGRHTVIRTSHPSPLGATKTASPFLGSKCFSRTNKALEATGKPGIDWNVAGMDES